VASVDAPASAGAVRRKSQDDSASQKEMNARFLDALVEWTKENEERFRLHGIVPMLSARSSDRIKNSQGLSLTHAKWQLSLVVWDSGDTKMDTMMNKTGASTVRTKRYASPKYLRDGLTEWLQRKTRA
jgi:hypothetical protein